MLKLCRGYYRCTHRHTKGCAATKQVQRSDGDESIYQIMYRGEHTCFQGAQAQFDDIIPAQMKSEQQPPPSPKEQEVYVGLSPEGELKVESEQEPENRAQYFRSLSFTPANLQVVQPDPIESYLMSYCSDFDSPTTSVSNYLQVLPYNHIGLTVETSGTEFTEAVSGPNSVTNSPMMDDFEFPIEELLDFGGNFSFEL